MHIVLLSFYIIAKGHFNNPTIDTKILPAHINPSGEAIASCRALKDLPSFKAL
jgi:hypothetical protein